MFRKLVMQVYHNIMRTWELCFRRFRPHHHQTVSEDRLLDEAERLEVEGLVNSVSKKRVCSYQVATCDELSSCVHYRRAREFFRSIILFLQHGIEFCLDHHLGLLVLSLLEYLWRNSTFVLCCIGFFTTSLVIVVMLADMGSAGGIGSEEESPSFAIFPHKFDILPIHGKSSNILSL